MTPDQGTTYKLEIEVLDSTFLERMGLVSQIALERAAEAAAYGAALIAARWKGYAAGGAMPDGNQLAVANKALEDSIKIDKVSSFHWIISSNHPAAKKAEDGTPAVDMKDPAGPWLRGKRTRVTKKGVPYLIIPFHHATPKAKKNAMPFAIYNAIRAKIRAQSFTVSSEARSVKQNAAFVWAEGPKLEANVHGEMVPRASYNWGSRLTNVIDSFPAVANNRYYEGMYAFDNTDHDTYITFRILSAKSAPGSWIIPAKPGYKMAKQAAESSRDEIIETLEQSLKTDLEQS